MNLVTLPVLRSTVASVINSADKYAFVISNSDYSIVATIGDNADYIANDTLFNHFEHIVKKYSMGIIGNIKISLYYTYLHRGMINASYSETALNTAYKKWYMQKYQYLNYFEPCIIGGLYNITVFTPQHNMRVLLASYSNFNTLAQCGEFVHVMPNNRNDKLYYRPLNKRDILNIILSDSENNEYSLLTTKHHIVNMVNNPIYENWHILADDQEHILIEDVNIDQLSYGICSDTQLFDGNGDIQEMDECVLTMDDEYYLKDECIRFDVGQYKGQWVKDDDDNIIFGYYLNDQEGYFHYHDSFEEIGGNYYHESYVYLNCCDECGSTHLTGDHDHYTSECGEYTFCSADCMIDHHSYRRGLDGLELHYSSANIVRMFGYGDSTDYIKGEKQYLGIELELNVIDGEGDSIQDIMDSSKQWIAKEDGSLESNGFELNSIPMGISEILNEVDNLILTENLKAFADAPRNDYGLHIHVSKAQLSAFEVFKIQELTLNIYNRVLIALNGFVASGYAKPIRQYSRSKVNGKNYIFKTDYTRYSLCNITDETLEFRYPRATLDNLRIKANIEACKALVHFALTYNVLDCKNENAYKAFALFVCQNKHIYKNLVKYAEQENLLGLWGI